MKFFIDSAELSEIRDLAATGLVDGVTTNPSLIAKSGRNFLDVIAEICAVVPGPVSAEVTALDQPTMLAEGRKLAKIAKNVTVKVPLTPDGLKACRALSDEGTMVNVTLCFSAAQAILAAKAGATFVSPFVGRLDDVGSSGMELIRDIVADLSQLSGVPDRGAGRFDPPSDACRRSRQIGRPCGHAPARRIAPDVRSSLDGEGSQRFPRRLEEDGTVDSGRNACCGGIVAEHEVGSPQG